MANFTNLGMNAAQTRSAMRGANMEGFNPVINGRMMRPPLKHINIFSVAKRGFQVRTLLFPKLNLAGCENGQRWVKCASIPDPITQTSPDQERGGNRIDDHDGWIAVIDMLNQGNFTLDQYAGSENPTFYANSNGTNFIAEGVFASENDEPTEEELRRAENARDKHYQYLTREAMKLAASSTKALNEWLTRYPDTHTAMAALGLKANWTHTPEVTVSCPNCGDDIKQGLAVHQSTAGYMCVIDADRALKAGAINRDKYTELTGKGFPGRPKSSAE